MISSNVKFQHDIAGFVKPGYEPVVKQLENYYNDKLDQNSQLCVYVNGQVVIDVCGKTDPNFSHDTLIPVKCACKSITPILLAIMLDQGYIQDLNDPICKYWPEFAKNQKEKITIAQLLRHEAGLHKTGAKVTLDIAQLENIKKNQIGERFENTEAIYPENVVRYYHPGNRDAIMNEIFRRVEPKGRTMGEYFRQEISSKLDTAIYFGLTDDEISNSIDAQTIDRSAFQKDLEKGFENGIQLINEDEYDDYQKTLSDNIFVTNKNLYPSERFQMASELITKYDGEVKSSYQLERIISSSKEYKQLEIPGSGALGTAKGFAKMAAIMAGKGTLNGQQLISEETWNDIHSEPKLEYDPWLMQRNAMTKGGFTDYKMEYYTKDDQLENNIKNTYRFKYADRMEQKLVGFREGFYGQMGAVGSTVNWNPTLDIGFAYATPMRHPGEMIASNRAGRLQKILIECVKAEKQNTRKQ